MQPRLNFVKVSPAGYRVLHNLDDYVKSSGLEQSLLELVKVRASQMNGCAYCIDMHTKDAREAGETEQRLYGLSAWRETAYYTDRERAAMVWTEAVTDVSNTHVPDEIYSLVSQYFSEKEIVDLTLAIAVINSWNRIAISFRSVPGTYQSPGHTNETASLQSDER
ncbi:MAG: carboxymuconolactone decarboxylase family protein [Ignavibacteriae bacterium]|nr:MAG: carboxymuconolactone decarboxylase family protein [Ignavibacteriota bacterium]